MNKQRERLIKLITDSGILCDTCGEYAPSYCAEALAERLLANGVFAPPCKIGDTVYHLKEIYKGKKLIDTIIVPLIVDSFVIGDNNAPQANTCDNERNEWRYYEVADFGRYVFLTREEAVQALKESEDRHNV